MGVQLSSLRVAVDGDASGYVGALKDVVTANDNAVSSAQRLVDSNGRVFTSATSVANGYGKTSSQLQLLQRQLDPTFRATDQLSKAHDILTANLERGRISQAQYIQLMALAEQRFDAATHKVTPFGAAIDGVKSQIVALSAGFGPVGVFLAGLGPLGLAAGAGLEIGAKAFGYMSDEANRLGEKSRGIREFGETVGLTSTQVQALQVAGSNVGLSNDQVTNSITKMTTSMDELRNGTGTALAQIRKLSPGLADQLATVSETSRAVDLLSQAWQEMSIFQQTALSKSLFGKNGASSGQLLGQIADAGGLQAYIAAQSKSIVLTDDQTKHLADLKTEIDASGTRIRDTIASWFSAPILENQKQARAEMEQLLAAVKDWSQSTAPSWWSKLSDGDMAVATQMAAKVPKVSQSRINEAFQETDAHPLGQVAGPASRIPLPASRPSDAPGAPAPTAAYLLSSQQAEASILGGAATGTEQLALKTAQLNAENEKAGGIYGNLVQRALAYYKVQQAGADLQIRVQNGAATATELYAQKQSELQLLVGQGKLTQDQATVSLGAYQKTIETTVTQMEVFKSQLPGLKQLERDSGSLRTQLDTLSTTSLTNLDSALVDFEVGPKKADRDADTRQSTNDRKGRADEFDHRYEAA